MSIRRLLPLFLLAGVAVGQKPEDKKPAPPRKEEPKKDEPKTRAEPSAEEQARAYFKSLDKNQDGAITKDEFPGSAEQFDGADRNKDRKLSEEELRTSSLGKRTEQRRKEDQKPVRERHQIPPEVAALRAARFATLDKDRDGRISRAEWNGGDDGFLQLDQDGDGFLGRGEFAPAARAEERAGEEKLEGAPMQGDSRELFQRADRNSDGKITRAEALDTRVGRLFNAIDKDKDGEISEREFQEAYAELQRQAYARDEGKSGRKERKGAYQIPFDEWDRDKDGKLGQDEFQGNKEWFPLADRNRDGVLSRTEAETFARERSHDEFMARYDTNGDGKVTREEFPGTDEVFRRADRNGDGVVTGSER